MVFDPEYLYEARDCSAIIFRVQDKLPKLADELLGKLLVGLLRIAFDQTADQDYSVILHVSAHPVKGAQPKVLYPLRVLSKRGHALRASIAHRFLFVA